MARRVAVACVTGARRGGERERADRVFRDIHGAEFHRHPNIVLVDQHARGDATGDDDVLRRHWAVVCADRARCSRTVSGRSAATGAAPTGSRATPTSPTSPARSPSASGTARRSSARSWSTRASIATCGRSSSPTRRSAASSIAIPRVNQVLDRRQRRRLLRRRARSTSVGVPAEPGGARACAAWSSCRPATRTPASAPARPTSRSTSSSARKRRSWSKCPGYGGYEWRGSPDGFDTPGGAFRWGAGVGFPSRNSLRVDRRVERLRAVRATRRRTTGAAGRHRRQPCRR